MSAIELCNRKICVGLAPDLVRLPQLSVLVFKSPHLLSHLAANTGPLAAVQLCLVEPVIESLRRAAVRLLHQQELLPARSTLALVIQDQAHSGSSASAENFFVVLLMMLHPNPELQAPANLVRINTSA